jgi:ATP-binding cassette subfamily G (WHITE) protein 2 (PDR)
MGTSGSGKTSFLNVLAGRYSVGHMTGQVLCNGKRRDTSFKRSIGYVEQDDLMVSAQISRFSQFSHAPHTLVPEIILPPHRKLVKW